MYYSTYQEMQIFAHTKLNPNVRSFDTLFRNNLYVF